MINLDKLAEHLKKSDASTITLSFSEIESILENKLPDEAKKTGKWWWNIKDSKKAKSWLEYGYYTQDNKNIPQRGNVCFVQTQKEPELQRGFSRIWYFLTDKDAESHKKATAVLEILILPLVTIVALLIAILTLYATRYPVKSQTQIKKDFESIFHDGDYAFDNRNYLEAASYYHQASLIAYDIYSEADSLHAEGSCYMLYGLSNELDKDYLNRALLIFERIVYNPKYKSTEDYQEARIDLCALYRFLGYDWQDEKWYTLVEELETVFDSYDIENIPENQITTVISIAESLSLYYRTALSSNIDIFLHDESYQQKVIDYLKKENQLKIKYNEYRGVKKYDEDLLISIYYMTSYMIVNAFSNPKDNCFDIMEEARTLCQDAILTIDLEPGNMLQLNMYIELKTNIGFSYTYSAFMQTSPDAEASMLKAYQELRPLFYWNDYETTENIITASTFILLTGLCTENDIELILDILSSYLQTTQENKDIPTQIETKIKGLVICSLILNCYDYESSSLIAQSLGQQFWTDLNTVLFDFLDSNQKEILEHYSEQFRT